MIRNYDAFTLAEVLITLVIIGIIAVMTIPTLINKTNKQEYVVRLKKAYSTLAQATNRIIAEEGNPRGDIGGWATSSEAVYNMYKKYLSNAKECGKTINGCFQGTYKHLNNTNAGEFDINRYTLVMADGTEISMRQEDFRVDCSANGNGTMNKCQFITVDVNGAKGPNHVGYDTFSFSLTPNGLFPTGCDYEGQCSKTSSIGWGCACKVLREGAINY